MIYYFYNFLIYFKNVDIKLELIGDYFYFLFITEHLYGSKRT